MCACQKGRSAGTSITITQGSPVRSSNQRVSNADMAAPTEAVQKYGAAANPIFVGDGRTSVVYPKHGARARIDNR